MPITTVYYGNRSIGFPGRRISPATEANDEIEPASPTSPTFRDELLGKNEDSKDERVLKALKMIIHNKILDAGNADASTMEIAKIRRRLASILMLFQDPTYRPPTLSQHTWREKEQPCIVFIEDMIEGLLQALETVERGWINFPAAFPTRDDAANDGIDYQSWWISKYANAAEAVCKSYGNRCMFTGSLRTEAYFIVPEGLAQAETAEHVWEKLSRGFPLGPWDPTRQLTADVDEAAKGKTSILPLSNAALSYLARNKMCLRPVPNKSVDPDRDLYVQAVYFGEVIDKLPVQSLAHRLRGPSGRSLSEEKQPGLGLVRHGDVFRISTTDPEAHPLPSAQLLEMQFCAIRMLNASFHPAALEHIFKNLDPLKDLDLEIDLDIGYKNTIQAVQKLSRRSRVEVQTWLRYLSEAKAAKILSEIEYRAWCLAVVCEARSEDRTSEWLASLPRSDDDEWCIVSDLETMSLE
ncbi:hypothetical protein SEUCBS139899_009474 [Sporothrix eucalyptigena]